MFDFGKPMSPWVDALILQRPTSSPQIDDNVGLLGIAVRPMAESGDRGEAPKAMRRS